MAVDPNDSRFWQAWGLYNPADYGPVPGESYPGQWGSANQFVGRNQDSRFQPGVPATSGDAALLNQNGDYSFDSHTPWIPQPYDPNFYRDTTDPSVAAPNAAWGNGGLRPPPMTDWEQANAMYGGEMAPNENFLDLDNGFDYDPGPPPGYPSGRDSPFGVVPSVGYHTPPVPDDDDDADAPSVPPSFQPTTRSGRNRRVKPPTGIPWLDQPQPGEQFDW